MARAVPVNKALAVTGAAVVCIALAGVWHLMAPRAGVMPGGLSTQTAGLLESSQAVTFILIDSSSPGMLSIPKPMSKLAGFKARFAGLGSAGGDSGREDPVFVSEMKNYRPAASLVFDGRASRGRETVVREIVKSLLKARAAGAEVSIVAHRHAVIALVLALQEVDFEVPRVVALGMSRSEFKRFGAAHFPGRKIPANVREWASFSLVNSIPPTMPIELYHKGEEDKIFAGEQVFSFLDMASFRGTGSHYQSAAEKDLAQAVAILTRAGSSMRDIFFEGLRADAEHKKRKRALEDMRTRALAEESASIEKEKDDSLSMLMKGLEKAGEAAEEVPQSAPRAPPPDQRFAGLPFSFPIPEGWKVDAPALPRASVKAGDRKWELSLHDRMDFRSAVRRRILEPAWATIRAVYYESPGKEGEQFSGNRHRARVSECFDLGGDWRFCGELIAAMDIDGGKGYLFRASHPVRESSFSKKIENLLLVAEMTGDAGLHTILLITPAMHESRYLPVFENALKTYRVKRD